MEREVPNAMPKKSNDTLLGWEIYFERHIHMYTHRLSASKNNKILNIDCEWLGTSGKDGNAIGILLYSVEIAGPDKEELVKALLLWAKKFTVLIRLFVTKEEFIDNQ